MALRSVLCVLVPPPPPTTVKATPRVTTYYTGTRAKMSPLLCSIRLFPVLSAVQHHHDHDMTPISTTTEMFMPRVARFYHGLTFFACPVIPAYENATLIYSAHAAAAAAACNATEYCILTMRTTTLKGHGKQSTYVRMYFH